MAKSCQKRLLNSTILLGKKPSVRNQLVPTVGRLNQICYLVKNFKVHKVLPNMYPSPKSISVQDMIVETLLGKSFIKIETPEPQAAASATPSKNLEAIF